MSKNPMAVEMVPTLVQQLYAIVSELEQLFENKRKFTPDGHLVGSIGEVIAAHWYGLKLLPHSNRGHDAVSSSGKQVEIKATQGSVVRLREDAEHLVVLLLDKAGGATEVYNGPCSPVWAACGPPRNGQRAISVTRLRRLMEDVPPDNRLPRVTHSGGGR